jgi:hypothetical protein
LYVEQPGGGAWKVEQESSGNYAVRPILHLYSRSCDCAACDGERRQMQDGGESYDPTPD